MGVWIEIPLQLVQGYSFTVTPFMGVWIEIVIHVLPSVGSVAVTPFMGVWIEIPGTRL